jgi:hypothetical protein
MDERETTPHHRPDAVVVAVHELHAVVTSPVAELREGGRRGHGPPN